MVLYGGIVKDQSRAQINSNLRVFIRKVFKELPSELYLEEWVRFLYIEMKRKTLKKRAYGMLMEKYTNEFRK